MDDFSTNRHSFLAIKFEFETSTPCRHPDLWFLDGNIALVADNFYFCVHQGILSRHSEVFAQIIKNHSGDDKKKSRLLEGSLVLELDDSATDLRCFLLALYDGVSEITHNVGDFDTVSSILRLSTKYQVEHIRKALVRGMSAIWPRSLAVWEAREAEATDPAGTYKPRALYPHPIMVINLAREVGALELLPSAFYDLSRSNASEIATGYLPPGCSQRSETHLLSERELMNALKGREHASRFLSTFVVNELESRECSPNCLHRNERDPFRKRICQATFEATTFEILRDVNGVVFHRSSDPLFAIMDADLMQNRNESSNARLNLLHRACEPCRQEFTASVDAARDEMWRKLPAWFGVDLPSWP
ncbi:hypothetical protein B0H34DRAFT_745968 [Crassisporium funariophilum]|nr:hypothetical protein B0H34DRAFT_745968 [Crassisporium funariophilum]